MLDGPINGLTFIAWVEQFLLPTLTPGDVVVMDNLGSHKGRAVRQLIRSAGARLLFLPSYSSDLSPIEQVFAKLKTLLRKAAPRSIEATWKQIGYPGANPVRGDLVTDKTPYDGDPVSIG